MSARVILTCEALLYPEHSTFGGREWTPCEVVQDTRRPRGLLPVVDHSLRRAGGDWVGAGRGETLAEFWRSLETESIHVRDVRGLQ